MRCEAAAGDGGAYSAVEVFTDPVLAPDVGFSTEPFVLLEEGLASAANSADETCTRTMLYSTPDQFLYEVLADGELLNLSQ